MVIEVYAIEVSNVRFWLFGKWVYILFKKNYAYNCVLCFERKFLQVEFLSVLCIYIYIKVEISKALPAKYVRKQKFLNPLELSS